MKLQFQIHYIADNETGRTNTQTFSRRMTTREQDQFNSNERDFIENLPAEAEKLFHAQREFLHRKPTKVVAVMITVIVPLNY